MAENLPKSPLVALDTNFILNLAEDRQVCWNCMEVLQARKLAPQFVVTATALQELGHMAAFDTNNAKRKLAQMSLTSLLKWRINPYHFQPVGNGIIAQIGDKIRANGLIPFEEKNDSYVIAEAALASCDLLVTSDGALLKIDRHKLAAVLKSYDVKESLILLHPKDIVKTL